MQGGQQGAKTTQSLQLFMSPVQVPEDLRFRGQGNRQGYTEPQKVGTWVEGD